MSNRTQQWILDVLNDAIAEANQLLAPLEPDISHAQTMLYSAESTMRVAAFLEHCRAIVDSIGGNTLGLKAIFNVPEIDVNLMRQILGRLQGLRRSVEKGLICVDKQEKSPIVEDPASDGQAEQFKKLLKEGRALLQGHDAFQTGVDHHRWYDSVGEFLQALPMGYALSADWAATGTSPLFADGFYDDQPRIWSIHKKLVSGQLKFLAAKAAPLLEKPNTANSVWALLHPKIVEIAKPRYEAKHFADAVEAALKHINEEVKTIVRIEAGKELDGAALMRCAFSLNSPIVLLDDMTTDTGKSIQQGYMEIFAGAMTGIRNPKAHANLNITAETAIHHLFLASLLMYRLDERQN